MKDRAFRGDIQALRAFAVVVVLLFHVDAGWMAGGYLGVDIFFVISGYLISGIILRDVAGGRTALWQFYLRRIRRLLPASVVTIAATLVVGGVLLSTDDLAAAARSGLAAAFSASNIVFWLEAGYFDEAADTKPFLHTWSLGVEEQFYLLWPAALLVFSRLGRKATIWFVVTSGLISLVAAEALLSNHPEAVFFLVPFRIFEFAAGALLTFVNPAAASRTGLLAFLAGVAVMLASCVLLEATFPMPGLVSLIPVAGAVLCIYFGKSAPALAMSRPVIFIGDISYSLYLVHWPIVVFYKYRIEPELGPRDQVLLLAAAVAAGIALNIFVERPMRSDLFWKRSGYRVAGGLAAVVIVSAAATHAWWSGGWQWRIPAEVREASTSVAHYKSERSAYLLKIRDKNKRSSADGDILLIGDSHGQDLDIALHASGYEVRRLFMPYDCQPAVGERPIEVGLASSMVTSAEEAEVCRKRFDLLLKDKRLRNARAVILAPRWKQWSVDRLGATIAALRKTTAAPIFVFGATWEYAPKIPIILQRYGRVDGIDEFAAKFEKTLPPTLNRQLERASETLNFHFVDKMRVACQPRCPVFVPGTSELTVWDYGHWTVAGASYFGRLLLEAEPELKYILRVRD